MIGSAPMSLQKDLATLFQVGALGVLTDAELLARFVEGVGDVSSEAAFEVLVARHGPMVLGACRRILRDSADADDAFQATFLILARKAPNVRVKDSLGRWLYGVSVKVARRARARNVRNRFAHLSPIEPVDPTTLGRDIELAELRALIDFEIDKLPVRYRSPVLLCYLEGLTQEQAAVRLRCPVGTIQSRLHRARERLRIQFTRRGITTGSLSSACLTRVTSPVQLPMALGKTVTSVGTSSVRGVVQGIVSAKVLQLATNSFGGMIMSKGLWAGALTLLVGFSMTGFVVQSFGGDEPKHPSAEPRKAQATTQPTLAEKYEKIRAEFEAQQDRYFQARAQLGEGDKDEEQKIFNELFPNEGAICRRIVELALEAPDQPETRDALIWVLNKPYMGVVGPYADEFGRAVALLVRYHGDDPIAISVGLDLNNSFTFHRESLLFGFYASAKSRESKGLARVALGRYLMDKPKPLVNPKDDSERQMLELHGGRYSTEIHDDDDRNALFVELAAYNRSAQLTDTKATTAEAARPLEEVVSDYADVKYSTVYGRQVEALLSMPIPTYKGRPLTSEEIEESKAYLAKPRTLGKLAAYYLDEIKNLSPGGPAPSIDGVDINGKPLKLSDYQGKVVALVFWGYWCGSCRVSIPEEKRLVEKYKDKPFALIGVNCRDSKEEALRAIKEEEITWPNWFDGENSDESIQSRYHVTLYPSVILIDPQGRFVMRTSLDSELFHKAIDDLMANLEEK